MTRDGISHESLYSSPVPALPRPEVLACIKTGAHVIKVCFQSVWWPSSDSAQPQCLQPLQELASRGVRGHFSFNLIGYVAHVAYCALPSAKKLAADIDAEPWSWPPVSPSALAALVAAPTPQMEGRNGTPRGRKRSLMTFSEVTDAFVEGGVETEQDAWILAKSRKVAGDDTLFNTLGNAPCVRGLVAKIRNAWHCETAPGGTLCTRPDYALDAFASVASVDARLADWMSGGWKKMALFLHGRGGVRRRNSLRQGGFRPVGFLKTFFKKSLGRPSSCAWSRVSPPRRDRQDGVCMRGDVRRRPGQEVPFREQA